MMSLRKIKPKELLHNAIFIRLLAVVIIAVLFSVFNGNYIGIKNVRNLMTDMVPYFVMGMGVTFVLLIGSIDLSIGSIYQRLSGGQIKAAVLHCNIGNDECLAEYRLSGVRLSGGADHERSMGLHCLGKDLCGDHPGGLYCQSRAVGDLGEDPHIDCIWQRMCGSWRK